MLVERALLLDRARQQRSKSRLLTKGTGRQGFVGRLPRGNRREDLSPTRWNNGSPARTDNSLLEGRYESSGQINSQD